MTTQINKLFKDVKIVYENFNVRPELEKIYNSMSKKRINPEYRLENNKHLNCLVFVSSTQALIWNLLSRYGISISDYKSLFKAQHKKEIEVNHPELISCRFNNEIKTIDINPIQIDMIKKKYILYDHEKSVNQCQFCRGVGFIQAIEPYIKPIENDIPIPVYQIECFESNEIRENLRHPKHFKQQ